MLPIDPLFAAHPLATVNAALNASATIALIVGFTLIKRGRVTAHRNVMLAAFGISIIFLVCYLIHHYRVGSVRFTGEGPVRALYYGILIPHVILAVFVPFLAVRTIWLGLRIDRVKHRWWAKFTFPIWLYVSVTGVLIYLMLYVLYPTPIG